MTIRAAIPAAAWWTSPCGPQGQGKPQPRRSAPRIAASPDPAALALPQLTWQRRVSPMCPDKSVTHVPGCTTPRPRGLGPRERPGSARCRGPRSRANCKAHRRVRATCGPPRRRCAPVVAEPLSPSVQSSVQPPRPHRGTPRHGVARPLPCTTPQGPTCARHGRSWAQPGTPRRSPRTAFESCRAYRLEPRVWGGMAVSAKVGVECAIQCAMGAGPRGQWLARPAPRPAAQRRRNTACGCPYTT